ncbi:hypothetical protein [Nonomuraea typhae]|uniref:hypothetical protein n=1 Tax=Nonomuraea typhae TaxID=2603600 RepID=UPI0012F99067|nr:hypothetical protein [Nonomuraea typhae]
MNSPLPQEAPLHQQRSGRPRLENLPPDAAEGIWGPSSPPPAPLILSELPTATAGKTAIQPGRALLYSDDRGQVFHLAKPPGLFGRRYSWRFEVDMSDHYLALHLEVASRSKAAKFRLSIDVGWRVSDPVKIVTSRIFDGNALVQSRIREAVAPICRGFVITQDADVEQRLMAEFGDGQVQNYPQEGICLFRFAVQVSHDRRASGWMAAQAEAHVEGQLEAEGIMSLRKQITSEDDLIMLLLHRAPDRVGDVISDIRKRKELSMQARIDLFDKLVSNDLIQEAEMDTIRKLIIEPIEGIAGAAPIGAFGIEQVGTRPARAIQPAKADDDEDVLPSQIVPGSVDNVTGWHPAPWQRGGGE